MTIKDENEYLDNESTIKILIKRNQEILDKIWFEKYGVRKGSIVKEVGRWGKLIEKPFIYKVSFIKKYFHDQPFRKPDLVGCKITKGGTPSKISSTIYGDWEVITS